MDQTATFSAAARLGFQYYAEQNFTQAIAELERATHENAEQPEVWRTMGYAYYGLRKYDDAVNCMQRAIAINNGDAESHYGLGISFAMLGDESKAIASYDRALELDPINVNAKNGLTGALLNRGQKHLAAYENAEAEADLSRAVKLNHSYAAPAVLLAQHYSSSGQTAKAKTLVAESLVHNPQSQELIALAQELGLQAKPTPAAQQTQARQAVVQAQMATCPSCKRQVAEWAAVCPHCNTQIKAVHGRFMDPNTIPNSVWQDWAYYVCASLICVHGLYYTVASVLFGQALERKAAGLGGLASFAVYIGVIELLLGIGLLFKNELVMTITKYLLYVSLFFGVIGFVMTLALGAFGAAAIQLLELGLNGLMCYLLIYHGD